MPNYLQEYALPPARKDKKSHELANPTISVAAPVFAKRDHQEAKEVKEERETESKASK